MNNTIFALDIGTRSVTGILLAEDDGSFTLIDYCTKEHNERSMFDGQIHDVVSVAEVITHVKETLEKDYGPLTEVSVAAAGRALKTIKASASLELNQQPITNKETVKHLELSAVHQAQQLLIDDQETSSYSNYYCVGYSILHYELDGERIGSLIDQRGDSASVQVIATFLPKIVVESLLAALQRSGLQMRALTLEPIAAIHVLIPESMRRLNVALIDIGAGTSDVAITKDGTIVAYGMVPLAGDKITEAMSDAYILDFPEAEQAKRDIVLNDETIIQDILGFETTVTLEDFMTHAEKHIEEISTTLAHEVLELNGKAPQAIMLIGGGSLTPTITSRLAKKVGITEQRVAVRDVDAIQTIKKSEHIPTGPDYVTPFAIAIAAKQNPVHYVTVTVNEQSIRMFEMEELTVGDALIQAGIELKKWFGKPGLAFFITMNQRKVTLPGALGTSPCIYVNGIASHVETPIQQNDQISIVKGRDGTSPNVSLQELIGDHPVVSVVYNQETYDLFPRIFVNGIAKDPHYKLADNDEVVIEHVTTIQQFLHSIGKRFEHEPFTLFVNHKKVQIDQGNTQIFVNNTKVEPTYNLQTNDSITIQQATNVRIQDVLNHLNIKHHYSIHVYFEHTPIQLTKQTVEVSSGDESLSMDDLVNPNQSITVNDKGVHSFIFQDVFRYVDIDVSTKTGSFTLLKNDVETTFYEPISDGDQLQIVWNA